MFFFFLDDQELNLVILWDFDYSVLLGFGFFEVGFLIFCGLDHISVEGKSNIGGKFGLL